MGTNKSAKFLVFLADEPEVFSEEEEQQIMLAACARGSGQVSEEEMERVLDWCVSVRIQALVLEKILDGKMAVSFPNKADMPIIGLSDRAARALLRAVA